MNNIFVSTSVFQDDIDVEVALREMYQNGITNVELSSIHSYRDSLSQALTKGSARWLVHNYFPPAKDEFIINLASDDPAILEASINQIKQSIDFCRMHDVELYSFHPGFLSNVRKKKTPCKNVISTCSSIPKGLTTIMLSKFSSTPSKKSAATQPKKMYPSPVKTRGPSKKMNTC